MQLKISNITNLTDARFFNALGANYLGFCFDSLHANNISIEKAKTIIQWLHNPVVVGEFGLHQSKSEVEYIAQQLELNDIQIPLEHPQMQEFNFEKFLCIDSVSAVYSPQSADFYVVKINESDMDNHDLKNFISNNKVFIEANFSKENIIPIIEKLQPFGIQISCKKEEKTGWSVVDEYAELLDMIGFS